MLPDSLVVCKGGLLLGVKGAKMMVLTAVAELPKQATSCRLQKCRAGSAQMEAQLDDDLEHEEILASEWMDANPLYQVDEQEKPDSFFNYSKWDFENITIFENVLGVNDIPMVFEPRLSSKEGPPFE
eukprot:g1314.t1